MLRDRILSGIILGVPVLALLIVGGAGMAILVWLVGSLALLEFTHLVARRGYRASSGLMLLWMALFVADRAFPHLGLLQPGMAVLLLLSMFWALARYRQGTVNAFTGFALTVGASFYVGWTAAHFVSLRALQDGLFWTLTIILTVWIADTGAYAVGRLIGRTPLIRDISPNKTWEGYWGGVVTGIAAGVGLTLLWRALGASPAVQPLHGLIIGAMVSVISPLGDFSMSMLKRYVNVKDSSNLIPGHGGFLDRIDSLIVACLLGYYYLTLFAL